MHAGNNASRPSQNQNEGAKQIKRPRRLDNTRKVTQHLGMSSAPLSVKPDQPVTAALRMGGAVLAFSLMAVAARQVSHRHDSFEILTYRSGIGLGLVLIYARATGQTASITTDRLSGHFLRNIVHFVGQNLWFTALTMIPLAQLFALEFTAPIWVILLAPLFLGEALTRPRLWSAALGFAGIMIVARPNLTVLDAGVLAAAGAAVCFAAVSILTKRLTTGQSVTAILF